MGHSVIGLSPRVEAANQALAESILSGGRLLTSSAGSGCSLPALGSEEAAGDRRRREVGESALSAATVRGAPPTRLGGENPLEFSP